jgi:hypothetical protein
MIWLREKRMADELKASWESITEDTQLTRGAWLAAFVH